MLDEVWQEENSAKIQTVKASSWPRHIHRPPTELLLFSPNTIILPNECFLIRSNRWNIPESKFNITSESSDYRQHVCSSALVQWFVRRTFWGFYTANSYITVWVPFGLKCTYPLNAAAVLKLNLLSHQMTCPGRQWILQVTFTDCFACLPSGRTDPDDMWVSTGGVLGTKGNVY